MNLNGKTILVTGGTSGIGEACVRHFASLGAKVVAASNQRERGEELEREMQALGQKLTFAYTDVADEASVKGAVDLALSAYGRLDGVHCNAGVWGKGKATDFDEAAWEKLMGVNVKGVFWTAKHAIPALEASGNGVFLVTTSVAAFVGFPAHALYCASKGALESLVRCLAVDHAGKVRVVGICPGTIDTPMLAATCDGWDKPVGELYAEVARRIPVRRLGQPEDIARTAAFLLTDEAGYINATSIVLDGGTMALPPW